MNDKIEFDVTINGKQVKKTLKEIMDEQDKLSDNSDKTSKNIKTNWVAMGAAAAAVATAFATMMKKSIDLERVLFGLNNQTKEWIRNASEQYGMSQEIIGGFVQTGKAAGMAGDDIEKMIDQAVALGRAYPHESTESFIDNLVMLNRTGEAQGYIVDVLEQKYGAIDLKTLSLAQKQEALNEATKGVNKEFNKTTASAYDRVMQSLSNTVTDLGNSFSWLLEESGILTGVNKIMQAGALASTGYAMAMNRAYAVLQDIAGYDTSDLDKKFQELVKLSDTKFNKLFGIGGDDITLPPINVGGGRPKPPPITDPAIEKERQIALAANERFWDEYNKTIMTSKEYQLSLLSEQYAEYNKYVKDKAALNEWYAEEEKRIIDENGFQMRAYQDMQLSVTNDLTSAFIEFAETGKASFADMANAIIQDLVRIQIQASMSSLLGSSADGGSGIFGMLSGMFSKGAAFSNGNVTAFAQGGVVGSPTVFPMANGMGLMGEAGAEAIMPLSRTSSGDLGVKSTPPIVNVNVQNYGNDNVKVEQSGDNIHVIISQIASSISRGSGDVGIAMVSRYGVSKR